MRNYLGFPATVDVEIVCQAPSESRVCRVAVSPLIHHNISRSSVYRAPEADTTCGSVYSMPPGMVRRAKNSVLSDKA